MADGNESHKRSVRQAVRARTLRASSTFPERLLWSRLRNRKSGFKFRRQHQIAGLFVDFFCAQCKLIVEVDGRSHDGRRRHDEQRQSILEREGFRVVRVTNDDVIQRVDAVADAIRRKCQSSADSASTPHPSMPQSRR